MKHALFLMFKLFFSETWHQLGYACIAILIVFSLLLPGCRSQRLPSERLYQYTYERRLTQKDGWVEISLGNPLRCPLRVRLQTTDPELGEEFDRINPVLLPPESDTVLTFLRSGEREINLQLNSHLGDPGRTVRLPEVALPFPAGRTYEIIQGYNSQPTHHTEYSRYAIDLSLARKDTVCAATDGFVVGVIDGYRFGGDGPEWRPYGNYITLYDPVSGLFTQYAHLFYQGSFVKVGEEVRRGDPIGLAGRTGQTNIQHLHFNCLVPVDSEQGLKSVPIEFVNGYKGSELKPGTKVSNSR